MLEIKNLSVSIGSKVILEDINVNIQKGRPAVLFGPNGSGKSTLLKAIMGFHGYHIRSGDIIFKGTRINDMAIEERVKLGIGIMYQHPPQIRGVTVNQIAGFFTNDSR